LLAESIARGGG